MHKRDTFNPARFYSSTWSQMLIWEEPKNDDFNNGSKNSFDLRASYFMLDNQLQNESLKKIPP